MEIMYCTGTAFNLPTWKVSLFSKMASLKIKNVCWECFLSLNFLWDIFFLHISRRGNRGGSATTTSSPSSGVVGGSSISSSRPRKGYSYNLAISVFDWCGHWGIIRTRLHPTWPTFVFNVIYSRPHTPFGGCCHLSYCDYSTCALALCAHWTDSSIVRTCGQQNKPTSTSLASWRHDLRAWI